ncbi:MAG TPA: hypothetical protein VIV55_02195 [Flavobacterium sp.]
MKKIILLVFTLQFAVALAQEQQLKITPLPTQEIDADIFVGSDGMENLYYIKNNIFVKKDKKKSWQYKNVSLGKITKIDFQNQLKIMLFYENFNTIILLDNQLSETQKINFSENEIPINATAAGIAAGNRLWIYNSLTQEIGLFDYLKNTFQSITPPISGNLKHYESDFNTFQWIDNNLNWYSCDIFGKITSLGKVSDFKKIQSITKEVVIYSKEETLYIQDLSKNKILPIENVEKSFKNFYYKDQILSIFTDKGISNYKIVIP